METDKFFKYKIEIYELFSYKKKKSSQFTFGKKLLTGQETVKFIVLFIYLFILKFLNGGIE